MQVDLPPSWREALCKELDAPYFRSLCEFVDGERQSGLVYPAEPDVFAAFRATPLEQVSVVLLGQDPYHGAGQAHGLAFSVREGVKNPASLRNIFKELHADIGCAEKDCGSLLPWARQGVLLLNTVLTVRAGEAHSHKNKGWERFTDAAIAAVSAVDRPTVFVLWGAAAQSKRNLIDESRHTVIASPHPSPLSAHSGFFGSRPFTKINEALVRSGRAPIVW
jgi:uracil-DNA glycosylase